MLHLSEALCFVRDHPFTAISLVILLAILANSIYNRYFHPLRHFPGPVLAGITDFWKLFVVFSKNIHVKELDLHEKYGPVVRIAPNLLVFDDPKLLPQVYHRKADKTDLYSAGILGEDPPPFQTQPHEEHARKRKRVLASFSMNNLQRFEGQIDTTIIELMDTLRERYAKTGRRLDWGDWARWFVYDAVTLLAFGKEIGFIREGRDVEGLIKAFHDMAIFAGLVAILPWLMNPLLKNPITKRYLMPRPGHNSGSGKIMLFRDKVLDERLKKPQIGQHHDVLDNLLQATNPDGSHLTVEEIKTECFVIMVAAPDTTAALICPLVNYIIQSPRIYAAIMAEIAAFEVAGKLSSPVATFEETNHMPYLKACVKEASRFAPSTPFLLPRYVDQSGMNFKGRWAAPGAEVAANPYVIHRDRGVFGEDADEYRPERWLEDEERTKVMEKYILSWGYGTRVCLGKNIAQLQVQKMVVQFFREFEVRTPCPEKPWREENMGIMMYYEHWLNIKERERQIL